MIAGTNTAKNVTPSILFEYHICQHAGQYFSELKDQEADVRLVHERQHRHSQFYRYKVSGGGKSFHVLVKTSPLHSQQKKHPKLGPRIEPSSKFEAQYRAMCRIYEYFTYEADPRFGAVRPLDILTEPNAIVMEEVPAPSLRDLMTQTSRLKKLFAARNPPNLALTFRNAGAWLCQFHSMPTAKSVEVRNGQREDFINTINKVVDFIINIDSKTSFLKEITAQTVQDAMQLLPEQLPLGLRHGDFGLPNILAGPDGKITVLDTPAINCSPIYEDLAYLLVGLKANWSQVLSQNLAYDSNQFAVYEREFLSGYFGQSPIPYKIIRLYEIQALLVRWSSRAYVLKGKLAGKNKMGKEFQLWLMRRFFKSMLQDLSK